MGRGILKLQYDCGISFLLLTLIFIYSKRKSQRGRQISGFAAHAANHAGSIISVFQQRKHMNTYISMLRGINVGGTKKVLMKDLVGLYESCGFTSVSTYVQSGNVVFDSREKNTEKLSETIENKIEQKLQFSCRCNHRTPQDLEKIIAKNPFLRKTSVVPQTLYVTFLSDAPDAQTLLDLQKVNSGADGFATNDREIFVHCPGGYGRTRLTNNFFETRLKRTATTRNWKTITTLLDMAAGKTERRLFA